MTFPALFFFFFVLSFFPFSFNFLFSTDTGTLYVMAFPTGTCPLCCPIDLDRDVEYLLFTRRNPRVANVLSILNPLSLRKSNFDKRNPTVVYIHGYSESAPGESSNAVRDAYLRRADYNVILVNWLRLATLPWYHTAVENTRLIGPHVARMISWLDAQKAVPLSKIHVIGFSLGAEVAGFMGKALAPRLVGRITGLDAAYPLYMNTGREGHLTASDAAFVDVIHTDGGIFGFPNPLGHADFYPNGGKPPQPGCTLGNILRRGFMLLIREKITCGHYRAWMLYVESVRNPLGFPASRCPRWRPEIQANCRWTPDALMGFAVDPKTRGKYYLRTNERSPFARNATGYHF
ncbi:endothelial lipase [Vespula pensylvanica]|nr:endothelial lipase [Vespula pensylvanica]